MAEMSVLQIAQEFSRRQSLPNPTTVVSAQDDTTRQVLGLLNEGIADITRRFNLPQCTQRYTFNHVNGAGYLALDLSGSLPDFKQMVPRTLWDTTTRIEVNGPFNAKDWETLINMLIAQAKYSFRIWQNGIYIFGVPNPTSSVLFGMEYYSRYGVYNPVAAANQETYQDDTSYPRIPSYIILQDIKWRWKANKGLPYAQDFDICEKMLASQSAQTTMADLSLDNQDYPAMVGPGLLVAAGSWPLP